MFNDILEEKKSLPVEEDKDEIIESLEYEVKRKGEIIRNLLKRITLLERQVERYESS